jgi:hypothetical protein
MSHAPVKLSVRETALWQTVSAGRLASLFATRSRVDVGWWFWSARLHAAVLGDELVLFAAGSRPFVQRTPLPAVCASLYNHVTGEVVLAPATAAAVRRLRMAPVDGQKLLAVIKGE